MSKPSILIIPGASATPEFCDSVTKAVAAQGYEIRALRLPTVALTPGPQTATPKSMYDDAAFIASTVEKLADEGKDVILMAHSYGGIPATESVKGLGKEERQKEGKKGGIVRLGYLTSLVPAVGVAALRVLGDVEPPFQMDDSGYTYHENIARSASLTFNDISLEEGIKWTEKFHGHSVLCFGDALTYAGYQDIPVSYLVCENDLVIPIKNQRDGIELIEKVSGRKVDVTSIQTGHVPMVSAPEKVVDWILGMVRIVEDNRV